MSFKIDFTFQDNGEFTYSYKYTAPFDGDFTYRDGYGEMNTHSFKKGDVIPPEENKSTLSQRN